MKWSIIRAFGARVPGSNPGRAIFIIGVVVILVLITGGFFLFTSGNKEISSEELFKKLTEYESLTDAQLKEKCNELQTSPVLCEIERVGKDTLIDFCKKLEIKKVKIQKFGVIMKK